MPFTLAHPAAIIPIHKLMGRYASISALIIGSMAPDFAFFLPLVSRDLTHSPWGALIFCLPAGLIAYIVFHLLLKLPMMTIMPWQIFSRVSQIGEHHRSLPKESFLIVAVSILLGACTHIGWDAFTHEDSIIVQRFGILQMAFDTGRGFRFYMFDILQYLSTLIGFAALGWWLLSWVKLHSQTSDYHFHYQGNSLRIRMVIMSWMLVMGVVGAVIGGIPVRHTSIDNFLYLSSVGALSGLILSVILFSLAWHAYFWYGSGRLFLLLRNGVIR